MSQINLVHLDGSTWSRREDFYDALAAGLGSVDWHGRNADAFLETMVYHLDLNRVQPPYVVEIRNVPESMREFLRTFASWLEEAREDRRNDPAWGDDVRVSVELTD